MTIRVLILLLLSHTNIIVQVTVNSISYSAALYIQQGVSLLYGRHNEGETYSFAPVALRQPLLVTLSAAKGLSRCASSCFAEFTLSVANVLSMTGYLCHPERSEGSVMMGFS